MMQMLLPAGLRPRRKTRAQQSQRLTDALFSQQREAREKEPSAWTSKRGSLSRRARCCSAWTSTACRRRSSPSEKDDRAAARLPLPMVRTRRFRPKRAGRRIDLRATLRESLREGGDIIALVAPPPGELHPPLVVLCDISGSMNPYSRMFLHFLHAITNDRDRVSCFVFGTRLTNITRQLRHRDVTAMPGSPTRSRTVGRHAHRASLREFNSSGPAARSGRTRACCSSPTASTARPARPRRRNGAAREIEPLPRVAQSAPALRQVRSQAAACARCCRTSICPAGA